MSRVDTAKEELFLQTYMSVLQIKAKLADTTFLWCELGRGNGKTTHILASRMDRVQNDMPGALLVLAAATYRSIIDNVLPGLMEYFQEHYERGVYYEIGKKPPTHFKPCASFIDDYRHTITFVNGAVIQFVSCDRPESMSGKNAAHLFVDEMLLIPEDKFIERIVPALRADRSKFGHSHYFMGISGFSSTPNFETDEDWFIRNEQNMNTELIDSIITIQREIDIRLFEMEKARAKYDYEEVARLQRFVDRWSERVNTFRRNQTCYLRASSFANVKILGIDYIENQVKNIKDKQKLHANIFAIRRDKVKDMFVGKFGKEHIFTDSYNYKILDKYAIDKAPDVDSSQLKYCNPNMPLIAGFDAGPFMSIVFAQRHNVPGEMYKEFRVIKDLFVYHPEQHEELAAKINTFFAHHRRKEIILHYDRANNQVDPEYRKYYGLGVDTKEADVKILTDALRRFGWNVRLMSLHQGTIFHHIHYKLCGIMFGGHDRKRDKVIIDKNECEALVSSINHSPLKREHGNVKLDKSSEKLPFELQAYQSTQIFTAYLYMQYGEFQRLLPTTV